MISHSMARISYQAIFDKTPTFPFNRVLYNSSGRVDVLGSAARLYLYFRDIGQGKLRDFKRAREDYFNLISFLPPERISDHYKNLFEYFCQGLNYTPVNIYMEPPRFLEKRAWPRPKV